MPFAGFDSQRGVTGIPNAFFQDLLPEIDHLGELKISLYALRRLGLQEAPYLDRADILADEAFTAGLGETSDRREAALTEALDRAVARGTLLRADVGDGETVRTLYLLNSQRGRAALRGLEEGRWSPDEDRLPDPTPERPNIFQLYEKNIGPLSPMLAETLRDAEAEYPVDWIEDAIGIALENNVRRWRYVDAILRSWRAKKDGMTEKIDKQLKQTAENISKASSLTSSKDEALSKDKSSSNDEFRAKPLGDPNCPHCHGIGYVSYDVPVGHPEFGRMHICSCRKPEIEARGREKLFALSNLNELENLTFETFRPRGRIGIGPYQSDSIERAFNQARQFVQSQNGWLVLQGSYGSGKTHLAAAITNESASLGVPAIFITVPDLLDQLRFAYNSPETTFEERFEAVRRAPLLVLDDFGTQNATEWAEEKLFQILNFRYTNRLPLVVTTNLPLDDIEPRLRSRMQDPELVTRVTIMAPDYRRPADDTGHHELSSLPHFSNLTFGNFEDRLGEGLPDDQVRSLGKASKAARQYAEGPQGWLILMGDHGTGKTHLAAAIGNYRAGLGHPPLLVSIPDLLDELRSTFSPENRSRYDRQFDNFKDVPLLLLDDLGRQSMTNWVREKLNQLFNHRHVRELPTVVTTSDTLESLYKTEPYIASRMLDQRVSKIYALTVPPYRGFKKR